MPTDPSSCREAVRLPACGSSPERGPQPRRGPWPSARLRLLPERGPNPAGGRGRLPACGSSPERGPQPRRGPWSSARLGLGHCRGRALLAALLDVRLHELLGVVLQHLVDLIQEVV